MNIANRIKKLLDSVIGISNRDHDDILELLENNEWGVALEILCCVIEQEKILINTEQFYEIASIGDEMDIEDELWLKINPSKS